MSHWQELIAAKPTIHHLLALALLLAALPFTPASADPSSLLEIQGDGATVTVTVPGVADPVAPGEATPLAIAVDAPDPEFAGWLVCGVEAGSWAATMNIPTWNAPSAECQLATISVPINVSVRRADGTGRRLGSGTLTAALLPCYRVALPVLQG